VEINFCVDLFVNLLVIIHESSILLYSNNESFSYNDYKIIDVVQIGFMLSGNVSYKSEGTLSVRICFDRYGIFNV
jgi:hypothetical protein